MNRKIEIKKINSYSFNLINILKSFKTSNKTTQLKVTKFA